MKQLLAALLLPGLVACTSAPKKPAPAAAAATATAAPVSTSAAAPSARKVSPYAPAQEDPNTRGHYTAGGLYRPGVPDSTPDYVPDVDLIPEPEVVAEPRSKAGNRSTYSVLGKQYHVLADHAGYAEQGLASYYGSKFHGRRTSNLEVYDMNAFTAAHKTLPLPSFARVTNLDNGKSVVVRVNDRGPFHDGRIVDLSYAAAVKLGITQRGTGRVEVRALLPGDDATSYAKVAAPPATTTQRASTMDTLLAALPIGSASALELPPGVRIATGKPTRLNVPAAAPSPAAGTPVPAMVTAPQAPAMPATAAVTTSPTAAMPDWRFDMHQNGRTMTADEFDAWMKARQVRVATGQPGTPVAAVAAPVVTSAPVSATTVAAAAPAQSAGFGDAITLQIASFSARGNADRALAMLHGAGIGEARLLDGNANGQQVWRLRVGPLDAASAPQLASRLAGLGFGPPHRVRE